MTSRALGIHRHPNSESRLKDHVPGSDQQRHEDQPVPDKPAADQSHQCAVASITCLGGPSQLDADTAQVDRADEEGDPKESEREEDPDLSELPSRVGSNIQTPLTRTRITA